MPDRDFSRQKKGLVAIDGAMALIVLLVVVQIWLLSVALESFLAGHSETALPAAIVSGALFLSCVDGVCCKNRPQHAGLTAFWANSPLLRRTYPHFFRFG